MRSKRRIREEKSSNGNEETCIMFRSPFAMNCWMSGECWEAVSVLAVLCSPSYLDIHTNTEGALVTTGPQGGDLTAGHGPLSRTRAKEMPVCCPSCMRIRFALIIVLLFTDLNRKGNAVGLESSSNKTSRYALDSLLVLTECLQLETCSFQKIPQVRPQADASLDCEPH